METKKQLKTEIDKLTQSEARVQKQLDRKRDLYNELETRCSKLTTDNDKLKKLVREQTSADLLVNALEAVGMIKTEKPKTLSEHQSESNRLLAMQQSAGFGASSNGLMGLAAAAQSGIFGSRGSTY